MIALVGVLALALPAPQEEPEAWLPTVARRRQGGLVAIQVRGRERLPEGAIGRVTLHLLHRVRRSPGDLPEDLNALIHGEGLGTPFDSQGVLVTGGRWEKEFKFPASASPVVHQVTFLFDPVSDAQSPDVMRALRKGEGKIRREAAVVAVDPRSEPELLSKEIGLIVQAISESTAALTSVAQGSDALPQEFTERFELDRLPPGEAERQESRGFLDPAAVRRVMAALKGAASKLEGAGRVAPFPWTVTLLSGAAGDTLTSSVVRDPAGYSYLWRGMFGRVLKTLDPIEKMFGLEVYLYQRTMLAELAEGTWVRYRLRRKGDPAVWNQWEREFPAVLQGLRDCHAALMAIENPAMKTTYQRLVGFDPKSEKPQDPRGVPFREVEAFFDACKEAVVEGREPADLKERWTALLKTLPPPPEQATTDR